MSDAPTPPEPPEPSTPQASPMAPVQPPAGYYIPQTPSAMLPIHEHASLSLGLGIVSVAGILMCFGPLAAPFAIGFGISAHRAIRREPGRWRGEGMATAGIITGAIGMLILIMCILAVIGVIIGVVNGSFDTSTSGTVNA